MSVVGRLTCVVAIMTAWVSPLVAQSFHPARYQEGSLPALSPLTVGGGEVVLELAVGSDGVVRTVRALRVTPPYTEAVTAAIKGWRFLPAQIDNARSPTQSRPGLTPVDSTVLVVGMFRAPTLNTPTLGQLPRDVGSELDATPFPVATSVPSYPPLAHQSGLVLIETEVDVNGRAAGTRIIRSSPPFDEPALGALRQWLFRPARIQGLTTPTLVYVIFGFPAPVTTLPAPAPPATAGPATAR